MAGGIPRKVMEMLQAVPLFSACNQRELRSIANLGTEVVIPDGHVLTEEGKPGREFFLLVEGQATCHVRRRKVATFGPGDFFGEMALLDHGPRHATVKTVGESKLLVLDGREFNTLLDSSPAIARKLLSALAERERANAGIRT